MSRENSNIVEINESQDLINSNHAEKTNDRVNQSRIHKYIIETIKSRNIVNTKYIIKCKKEWIY